MIGDTGRRPLGRDRIADNLEVPGHQVGSPQYPVNPTGLTRPRENHRPSLSVTVDAPGSPLQREDGLRINGIRTRNVEFIEVRNSITINV